MRIGSLFSGYEGIGLALKAIWPDAQTAFVADIDPGACKILAHRLPAVPNLGDVARIDWATWRGLVDIVTAGFPCQDVSAAGKRAGLRRGTRTGLWHETARAIRELRPHLVVLENVRGLLSARGDDPTAEHAAAEATASACKHLITWLDAQHARAVAHGRTAHARIIAARRARAVGCRKRALGRARWHERRLVRAIGTVLGSLADIGYDAAWCGLRAADVGAAHGRFRVFIVAWPADAASDPWRVLDGDGTTAGHAASVGCVGREAQLAGPLDEPAGHGARSLLGTPRAVASDPSNAMRDRGETKGRLEQQIHNLLPTPRATDGTKGGPGQRGSSGDLMLPSAVALLPTPAHRDFKNAGDPAKTAGRMAERGQPLSEVAVNALLPTPAVNDMGEGKTVERWDEWTADMQAKHGNGNGHGKSLAIEAQRLFQTPSVSDATGGHESRGGARSGELLLNGQVKMLPTTTVMDAHASGGNPDTTGTHGTTLTDATVRQPDRWGDYAAAIARWEAVLGRPAPAPTMTSTKGNPQLSPRFTEWLMGLPDGWITDVPGITRNEALKACGNGVVPQQAEAAIRWLLARIGQQGAPARMDGGAA